MNKLELNTCEPCQGGIPPLSEEQIQPYLQSINSSWNVIDNTTKIQRGFEFSNFKEALSFVNSVGQIAENEGHHPNIYLHDYNKVTITLYTHKIGGLHKNDFILAAKIDQINRG